MTKVAQIMTPVSIRGGKQVQANGATIEQGLLLQLDSTGSTVSLGAASVRVEGIAFGLRHFAYAPTTQIFAAGEPLAVVWGPGEILLSTDFFVAGTLPTVGASLYVGAGGKWGTTGSTSDRVGHVREIVSWVTPVGVGVLQSLAHVHFQINA